MLQRLALIVFAALLASCGSITEAEARIEATRLFEQYLADFAVDPSGFEGPVSVPPPVGAEYAYEWRYADGVGRVTIFVWVSESGNSRLNIEGDSERLHWQLRPRRPGANNAAA